MENSSNNQPGHEQHYQKEIYKTEKQKQKSTKEQGPSRRQEHEEGNNITFLEEGHGQRCQKEINKTEKQKQKSTKAHARTVEASLKPGQSSGHQ